MFAWISNFQIPRPASRNAALEVENKPLYLLRLRLKRESSENVLFENIMIIAARTKKESPNPSNVAAPKLKNKTAWQEIYAGTWSRPTRTHCVNYSSPWSYRPPSQRECSCHNVVASVLKNKTATDRLYAGSWAQSVIGCRLKRPLRDHIALLSKHTGTLKMLQHWFGNKRKRKTTIITCWMLLGTCWN